MEREQQLERLKRVVLRVASNWSPKLAETLSSRPEVLEQLLETGIKALGEELRIALIGASEGPLRELVTRLQEELDEGEVINAVARPLASLMATWLKEEEEARNLLISAITTEFMNILDPEEFAQEVAEQVSEQVARQVQVQIPPTQSE